MIKNMLKKLKERKGESLSETLVAVMVGTLAMALLAAMIGSAGKIIEQSQTTLQNYYSANSAIITKSGTGTGGTALVSDEGSHPLNMYPDGAKTGENPGEIKVIFYSNSTFTEEPVIAYKVGD